MKSGEEPRVGTERGETENEADTKGDENRKADLQMLSTVWVAIRRLVGLREFL